MKKLDNNRIEEIEFSARKVITDYPETAEGSLAQSMLFLIDSVNILKDQNKTLTEKLKFQKENHASIAKTYGRLWGESHGTQINSNSSTLPSDEISKAIKNS